MTGTVLTLESGYLNCLSFVNHYLRIIHMHERLLIGLRDAAASLGLSHWTLRDWIRRGKLKPVRLGRRVLVEPAELARLVEQGRIGADNNEHHISDHRA